MLAELSSYRNRCGVGVTRLRTRSVYARDINSNSVPHCDCDLSSETNNLLAMFGGFGGALKGLGSKAEQLLEKKKHDVEELGVQKKQAASALLEEQAKKTGDLLWQTKSDLEQTVVGSAKDAKHTAIDAFDEEFSKAEKAVDGGLQTASSAVDAKLKEADQFLDEKREQVHKAAHDATTKAAQTKEDTTGALLGKAKGVLNF